MGIKGVELLDLLFQRPLVNVNLVKDRLDVSFLTANRLVERIEEQKILEEITGATRNRVFRYSPYLAVFADPDPDVAQEGQVQTTEAEPSGRPA